MRALTLWRPWPWAIFHAPPAVAKRIENRPWKPWPSIIERRIALHAGQTFQKDAVDDILRLTGLTVLPASATDNGLIGVVTIQGVAASEAECERFLAGQSDWFSGPYAWLLKDVLAFPEPILCKGAQGLWEIPHWAQKQVDAAVVEAGR